MSKIRQQTAKILVHSEGLGAPDPVMVRQRALELALLDGREEANEEDWRRAKLALHGAVNVDGELSDEMAMALMVSERDMVSADLGHQADRVAMEDDRNVVEELIMEGMEEAEHERMLEARKSEIEEDGVDGPEEE